MLGLSIHFVGRDVNELLHAGFHCRLKHDVCAADVCLREGKGVAEAEIDVRLCGEMEDCVDVMLFQAAEDGFFVGHVAKDELEVGSGVETFGVVESRTIVDLVKGDDTVGVRIG